MPSEQLAQGEVDTGWGKRLKFAAALHAGRLVTRGVARAGGRSVTKVSFRVPSPAYLRGGSMARRPRSSRAWHFVLSGVRREADGWAGARGWGYDSDGQVGWAQGLWVAQGRLSCP